MFMPIVHHFPPQIALTSITYEMKKETDDDLKRIFVKKRENEEHGKLSHRLLVDGW